MDRDLIWTDSQRVAAALRDWIIRGELLPGSPLDQNRWAARLATNTPTLREAFAQLRYEGLIVVGDSESTAMVRRVDSDSVRDVYRMRYLIEPLALDHAALATTNELNNMSQIVAASRRAKVDGHWSLAGTTSLRFHQSLVAFLHCRTISDYFESSLAHMRLVFALMADEASFQAPWVERDAEIADLVLRQQYVRAKEALVLYLSDSEQATLAVVAKQP